MVRLRNGKSTEKRQPTSKKKKIKSAFPEIMIPLVSTEVEIKIMKDLLTAKDIEHKIIPSLDYKHYINDAEVYGINNQLKSYLIKIQNMFDVEESINQFDNFSEHHPTPKTYYSFLEKYLPEYIGEKSLELLNTDFNGDFNKWMVERNPNYQMLNDYDGREHPTFCFGYF